MFSDTATGAARRAYELHKRIPGDLSFVAFVTEEFTDEWMKEFPRFEFVRIGSSRSFIHRLKEGSGTFWKQLLDQHDCGLWVTDTLPVPARIGTVKTCITVHDLRYLSSWKYVSLKRYLLLKAFMSRSLARADSVIAVSNWTGEQLKAYYSLQSDKLAVIYNSVDSNFAESIDVHCNKLEKPYLLSVGHLEKRKNFLTLIRAFSSVTESWDGLLVIVGKDQGSLQNISDAAEKYGVSDRLILKSAISYEELRGLYLNCEVVICPSLYEGFGMTLLEGMAAGRPVIASDIPSHREVAKDAALLVDPADKENIGFARAILEILNNRKLAGKMIDKGKTRVKSFSWDKSAKKLESIYRSLLEE